MSIILKPNKYAKGVNHNIVIDNSYDTVKGKYMLNDRTQDTLLGSVTRSVSTTVAEAFTNVAYQKNIGRCGLWVGEFVFAKSIVGVKEVTESFTFNLTGQSIKKENCNVSISLSGITKSLDRGSFAMSDVDTYLSIDEKADWTNPVSISNWLVNEFGVDTDTFTNISNYVDYTKMYVNLFAFVKDAIHPASYEAKEVAPELGHASPLFTDTEIIERSPTASDILTTWCPSKSGSTPNYCASTSGWFYNGQAISMPGTLPASGTVWFNFNANDTAATNKLVAYRELYSDIKVNIIQIDDYTIQVNVTFPKKYLYCAATRTSTHHIFDIITSNNLDSLAFLDLINSITVELHARTLDTNTVEFEFSEDESGALTSVVKNNNILTLGNNEFITKDATWDGHPWYEQVSTYILSKYKNGKTVLECEVPAEYAIENGLDVNSIVYVKMIDGTFASRGYRAIAFEIKNINKVFRDDQFTWTLKMLESDPDLSLTQIYDAKMLLCTPYSLLDKKLTSSVYLAAYPEMENEIWFYVDNQNRSAPHSRQLDPNYSDGLHIILTVDDPLLVDHILTSNEHILILSLNNNGSIGWSEYATATLTNVGNNGRLTFYILADRRVETLYFGGVYVKVNHVANKDKAQIVDTAYESSVMHTILKLPQITYSEDSYDAVGADDQLHMINNLNDIRINNYTILCVVKVPYWAQGSWPTTYSGSPFQKSYCGYILHERENSFTQCDSYYKKNVESKEDHNTLNATTIYCSFAFKITAEQLKQGVIPCIRGSSESSFYNLLQGSLVQLQWYLIKSGSCTAREAYEWLVENGKLEEEFGYKMPSEVINEVDNLLAYNDVTGSEVTSISTAAGSTPIYATHVDAKGGTVTFGATDINNRSIALAVTPGTTSFVLRGTRNIQTATTEVRIALPREYVGYSKNAFSITSSSFSIKPLGVELLDAPDRFLPHRFLPPGVSLTYATLMPGTSITYEITIAKKNRVTLRALLHCIEDPEYVFATHHLANVGNILAEKEYWFKNTKARNSGIIDLSFEKPTNTLTFYIDNLEENVITHVVNRISINYNINEVILYKYEENAYQEFATVSFASMSSLTRTWSFKAHSYDLILNSDISTNALQDFLKQVKGYVTREE